MSDATTQSFLTLSTRPAHGTRHGEALAPNWGALLARPAVPWRRRAARLTKAAIDRLGALLLLLLLAPIFIAIAAMIRLGGPGPILFRQTREGLRGEAFTILKFRSMTVRQDGAPLEQTRRDDPRCTRLGRVLRRTSLDELPQLINVLRGDMSLVGPRPHAIDMRTEGLSCQQIVPGYGRRHDVKPGITGLAQISGARGATEHAEQLRRRVALDLDYVANWSLALDATILLRTISAVLGRDGAF